MTVDEFRQSLNSTEPPAGLTHAQTGLWWDAKGDWERAHESAQQDEGPESSWVHAYLHRKEGDQDNAAYWYNRAGKPVCREALDAELVSPQLTNAQFVNGLGPREENLKIMHWQYGAPAIWRGGRAGQSSALRRCHRANSVLRYLPVSSLAAPHVPDDDPPNDEGEWADYDPKRLHQSNFVGTHECGAKKQSQEARVATG